MTDGSISIDTGTDELLCAIRDRVAVITLNRPEARNSLSDHLTPALRRMIKRNGDDPDVGALLITGAGTAFCSGGDVKGMGGSSAAPAMSFGDKVARLRERQRTLTGVLVSVRKPTIAALPGPAAGAGLAIALACDIRIAAESTIMTTGYARIALTGDYGISWLLTRLAGTARARELMFLSERIDARRCEALGLVNRVVPDAKLQNEAFGIARNLANGPASAYASIKDNLDLALSADFLTSLDQEAEKMVVAAGTEQHAEAVRAFIEKRVPSYSRPPNASKEAT
jgi:2-(1,2-epoxy-1,2-dihydrophenyl)acetyl-CoA isomerase